MTHLTAHPPGAAFGPILRAIWLIGLPLTFAAWARLHDRRLLPAALFAGAAAALLPPALLEVALPVVISHNPGGGSGMIGFFWHGMGDLALAGLAAGAALLLRRRAEAGALLPRAALIAAFLASTAVPRPTALNRALSSGTGGAGDPLAPLLPLAPLAPWIALLALAVTAALAVMPWRMG